MWIRKETVLTKWDFVVAFTNNLLFGPIQDKFSNLPVEKIEEPSMTKYFDCWFYETTENVQNSPRDQVFLIATLLYNLYDEYQLLNTMFFITCITIY